jgi:4-hydroxy-tetrahydrodipicolinate reductase
MELVGLWVHSPAKTGRDAGELCGLPPTGVLATNSMQEILALQPDCVLYMPFDCNYEEIAQILRAGVNIVTTKGEFQNPDCIEPEIRAAIEAACEAGQSSIHSTGSSPGFVTDTLPLVLASLQRRFDSLTVDEYADVSSRNSPDILFRMMGFGVPPSETGSNHIAKAMWSSRRRSFNLLADAFGLPLDHVESGVELGVARNRTEIAAGVIEAGTVAGTRITISGIRNGRPLFRFRANWYCTADMDVDWQLMHSGWRILLQGDCPLDMTITFPVSLEEYPLMAPGLTAHPAVNAVAQVCAAPPGICTSLDLPVIAPRFG